MVTTNAPVDPRKKDSFAHKLYTGEFAWEFVGRKKLWYTISAIALSIALLALIVRGLNLGIEFRGGADFQAPVKVNSQTVTDVRKKVTDLNLTHMDDLSVKTIGNNRIQVQTRALDSTTEVPKVRAAIADITKNSPETVAYSLIGPSWGKQITQQGLIGLVVFLGLVMLLIGIYFREWKMSLAAIIALFHDLVLTVGLYALIGFTFTPATLIGVLTILGYSLYDTVVVFDKVRENTKDIDRQNRTYSAAANKAVNQVLIRSINTTIIGVLPVAALLIAGIVVLGTGPLKDLGLALFVGMIVGAYSSVFIATPVLAQMKEAEPQMQEHRQRLVRRQERHADKTLRAKADQSAIDVTGEPVGSAANLADVDPVAKLRPAPPAKKRPMSEAAGRMQPTKATRERRKKGS